MSKLAEKAAKRANKRQRTIITPEGIAVPVNIASRASRLGALILDFMIVLFSLLLFQLAIRAVAGGLFDEIRDNLEGEVSGAAEFLAIIYLIFMFVFWYGYFLVQELGPRGATLGKRLVKIRIASRGGGRLTPEAVIARNLLRDVEIFYPLSSSLFLLIMSVANMDLRQHDLGSSDLVFHFCTVPLSSIRIPCAQEMLSQATWVVDAPRTKLADALSTHGAAVEGTSDMDRCAL